jgi:hypothetical protein
MYRLSKPTTNDVKYLSKKDFTGAVAKWAVRLSPDSCPYDFDRVIIKADGAWTGEDWKECNYDEFKEFVHGFIFNTPEIIAWSEVTKKSKFVSAFDLPVVNAQTEGVDLHNLSQSILSECWNDV